MATEEVCERGCDLGCVRQGQGVIGPGEQDAFGLGSHVRTWSRTSANHGPLSLPLIWSTGQLIRRASSASKRQDNNAGRSVSKNVAGVGSVASRSAPL